MENSKNLDLIDKFIANERKSKIWTTVNIAVFCLLGMVVFFLAFELNKSNSKFKTQNIELTKTKDELADALKMLAAYNASLQEDSLSLSNRIGNYDSLKKVLDTVLLLFNKSDYSKDLIQNNVKISTTIRNSITKPDQATGSAESAYRVYIHYMPGYDKLSAVLAKELKQQSYIIPRQEQINSVTFDPVVKYFYDEDKSEAERVVAVINKSNDYFARNPAKIQKLNLKSSRRQLEVWIGQYEQQNVEQIIKQQPLRNLNKAAY